MWSGQRSACAQTHVPVIQAEGRQAKGAEHGRDGSRFVLQRSEARRDLTNEWYAGRDFVTR